MNYIIKNLPNPSFYFRSHINNDTKYILYEHRNTFDTRAFIFFPAETEKINTEKIEEILTKYNIKNWNVGNYFRGVYNISDDNSYNENGLALCLDVTDKEIFYKLSKDIFDEYKPKNIVVSPDGNEIKFMDQ